MATKILVKNFREAEDAIQHVFSAPGPKFIDLETSGLKPFGGDRIAGIAFKGRQTDAFYVPIGHKVGVNLPYESIVNNFADRFMSKDVIWVNHNIPFDYNFFPEREYPCKLICTQIGMHLINENEMSFGLKQLSDKYVEAGSSADQKMLKEKLGGAGFIADYAPEMSYSYACQDVIINERLFDLQMRKLAQSPRILKIWMEMSDYIKAVAEMNRYGLIVDTDAIDELIPVTKAKMEEIREALGYNPMSHVQVRKALKLPDKHTTNFDYLSTRGDDESRQIIKYRQYGKLVGSFYEPLKNAVSPTDGKLHPNIKIPATVAGRPSCNDPNMQALPRERDVYNVRSLITCESTHTLVSIDWSQVELRLIAHYTQSPNLMKAYIEDLDLHQMTADMISIPRPEAKTTNFSVVYEITAPSLAIKLRKPVKYCEKVIKGWKANYPEVPAFHQKCWNDAVKNKKITMWTGRERRYRYPSECRTAMSNIIQGGVGEMMRIGSSRVYRERNLNKMFGKNVFALQVHDELLFKVEKSAVDDFIHMTIPLLEDFDFSVPIICECKVGDTWGQMKPYAYR